MDSLTGVASGDVRLLRVYVRFTPSSGRGRGRSRETVVDPKPSLRPTRYRDCQGKILPSLDWRPQAVGPQRYTLFKADVQLGESKHSEMLSGLLAIYARTRCIPGLSWPEAPLVA